MSADPTSLENLHDVVSAPPAPFWPPAPAWYWVLAALALGAAILLARSIVHMLHNRYRREALAELDRHEAALSDAGTRASAIISIAVLLKRAALSVYSRETVASLYGTQWLEFLDRTGRMQSFATGGAWLERVAYHPPEAAQLDEPTARKLAHMAREWIKRHRVEKEVASC